MWSSCECGVSSSLLEKMHGGGCGGQVCIICSALDFFACQLINKCKNLPPEVPMPRSRKWRTTRGWSYRMLVSWGRWVSSCCPASWSHPETCFILKLLGGKKFWSGRGEGLILPPDLCERAAFTPDGTTSSFLIASALPSAAFAAKGALTIRCHTSKTCNKNSFLRSFSFSFMFPEYIQTFNNLEL